MYVLEPTQVSSSHVMLANYPFLLFSMGHFCQPPSLCGPWICLLSPPTLNFCHFSLMPCSALVSAAPEKTQACSLSHRPSQNNIDVLQRWTLLPSPGRGSHHGSPHCPCKVKKSSSVFCAPLGLLAHVFRK